MSTRGFLLGKFLPPHAGHIFMCRTAMQLCDELTVLVCTLDRDPIEGALRARWMRELLPGARVVHFDRDVPQEPSEHPDFWTIWREICVGAHSERIDLVFGSEPYVIRLAQELGARPWMIDPDRIAFPVSGTAVRDEPWAYWHMIPGVVRPHFQKRIVTIGAESTGKTTLTALLASRYDTLQVPEYGRTYDAWRTGEWSPEDFTAISMGHAAMRAAISPQAGPLLFEDTDELATRVWEKALTGGVSLRPRPARPADLYLLLDTDLTWMDDGTRYMADQAFRQRFQQDCRQELAEAGGEYVEIGGVGEERLRNAMAAVEARFPGHAGARSAPNDMRRVQSDQVSLSLAST